MSAELPESLRAVARDAAAAGLGELDEDRLQGLACVRCGRRTRRMVPLPIWFGAVDHVSGGVQLFECELGDPEGCQAGTKCSGVPSIVRRRWQFGPRDPETGGRKTAWCVQCGQLLEVQEEGGRRVLLSGFPHRSKALAEGVDALRREL